MISIVVKILVELVQARTKYVLVLTYIVSLVTHCATFPSYFVQRSITYACTYIYIYIYYISCSIYKDIMHKEYEEINGVMHERDTKPTEKNYQGGRLIVIGSLRIFVYTRVN